MVDMEGEELIMIISSPLSLSYPVITLEMRKTMEKLRSIPDLIALAGTSWKDAAIGKEMWEHVLGALDTVPQGAEIGSGALIAKLLPSHTLADYKALVSLLQAVRKYPGAPEGSIWRYTGKKNRYGKPALVWLGTKDPEEF